MITLSHRFLQTGFAIKFYLICLIIHSQALRWWSMWSRIVSCSNDLSFSFATAANWFTLANFSRRHCFRNNLWRGRVCCISVNLVPFDDYIMLITLIPCSMKEQRLSSYVCNVVFCFHESPRRISVTGLGVFHCAIDWFHLRTLVPILNSFLPYRLVV